LKEGRDICPGVRCSSVHKSDISLREMPAHMQPKNKDERARRQDRLQWATATWDPLPFDADSARMYGRVFAAARAAGQSSRARLADLLIVSTAAANGLPLYTRNPSDFAALERILKVVKV